MSRINMQYQGIYDGPEKIISYNCYGCKHLNIQKSHKGYCGHPKRPIIQQKLESIDTDYSTPSWCPVLKEANNDPHH